MTMRSGSKVEVKDWMESVDEINNDLDEFFYLPGTVAEHFPGYETEESKEADERYNRLWHQLIDGLDESNKKLLHELDSVVEERRCNMEARGMALGMTFALRMIGLSKKEVAKRVKPWVGPGLTNGKIT